MFNFLPVDNNVLRERSGCAYLPTIFIYNHVKIQFLIYKCKTLIDNRLKRL